MQKIKKRLFNDGFLDLVLKDEDTERTLYSDIPYGLETVTDNRFNGAMANGTRIDKVLHIPIDDELPGYVYIKLNDKYYTIYKQQPIPGSFPPTNVLTLKEFE